MSEFGAWEYAIFWLPGGAGLALMLLCALGGGRHHSGAGSGHHALGHPASGHHALGHHGPAPHGVHAPHPPAGHPPAGHPPAGHPHGAPSAARPPSLFAFFGGGRVPLPLLWGSGLLGWGLFGFWTMRLLLPSVGVVVGPLTAVIVAAFGGLAAMRATAYLWTRLLPTEETYVTGTVDLCGLTGKAAYPVDHAHGRVHVYDVHGTLHDVSARTAAGQPAIPRGRTVLVTDYDAARGVLIVEELP